MKSTKVTLATTDGDKREFDVEHAERILRMRNSGWVLPTDSEYQFKDGTISRRDKKDSK